MFKCFICGCECVIWDSDFDTEDVGLMEEGIVSFFHCSECGADYQVIQIFENNEEE